MSVREICVQYLGSVLRLPVAIEDADLAKATRLPFGRPVLEREVEKVVLTQPDGMEQVFVPERTCRSRTTVVRFSNTQEKRIVEKLDSLVYDLERLGTRLDIPSSDMTLGEYEDKRREIVESCARSIEEMLGAGTCHMRLAYEEEDADGCIWPDHYECDACGAKVNGIMPFYDTEIPPKYCPSCRRRVVSE